MKELRFAHIDGLNKDPCLTDANTKAKGYLQNYTEELTSIKQACHSKRFDNGRIIDVGEAVELMFVNYRHPKGCQLLFSLQRTNLFVRMTKIQTNRG